MNWGCFLSVESLPILIKTVKHKHFLSHVMLPLVLFLCVAAQWRMVELPSWILLELL